MVALERSQGQRGRCPKNKKETGRPGAFLKVLGAHGLNLFYGGGTQHHSATDVACTGYRLNVHLAVAMVSCRSTRRTWRNGSYGAYMYTTPCNVHCFGAEVRMFALTSEPKKLQHQIFLPCIWIYVWAQTRGLSWLKIRQSSARGACFIMFSSLTTVGAFFLPGRLDFGRRHYR